MSIYLSLKQCISPSCFLFMWFIYRTTHKITDAWSCNKRYTEKVLLKGK